MFNSMIFVILIDGCGEITVKYIMRMNDSEFKTYMMQETKKEIPIE